MTTMRETMDQRVYHELKVVAGCLTDATLAAVIRELDGWTGRPLMAKQAFLEWQADREFAVTQDAQVLELEEVE